MEYHIRDFLLFHYIFNPIIMFLASFFTLLPPLNILYNHFSFTILKHSLYLTYKRLDVYQTQTVWLIISRIRAFYIPKIYLLTFLQDENFFSTSGLIEHNFSLQVRGKYTITRFNMLNFVKTYKRFGINFIKILKFLMLIF